jgi:hypothetical protein
MVWAVLAVLCGKALLFRGHTPGSTQTLSISTVWRRELALSHGDWNHGKIHHLQQKA